MSILGPDGEPVQLATGDRRATPIFVVFLDRATGKIQIADNRAIISAMDIRDRKATASAVRKIFETDFGVLLE